MVPVVVSRLVTIFNLAKSKFGLNTGKETDSEKPERIVCPVVTLESI
jgi:hypothetical protein